MGRTNATFRDLIRAREREWQPFRRALRRRDQAHFDRLLEYARAHADAAGTLNPTDPVPAILLSVALAQERERAALEERVAERRGLIEEQHDLIEEQRERIDELADDVDRLEATLAALEVHALEGDDRELPPADEREGLASVEADAR